jgi:hypothetical protein
MFIKRFLINTILLFIVMIVLFHIVALFLSFVNITEGVYWMCGAISVFYGFINTVSD